MHVFVLRAAAMLLTLGVSLAEAAAGDTATCKAADGDDSIAACSRIIARYPRYATAYYSRARVYGRNGDYDRAIADLDLAIRLQPKNADFYTERCWAWDNKHEEGRAIADCAQATKLDQLKAVTFGQRADAGAGRPHAFTQGSPPGGQDGAERVRNAMRPAEFLAFCGIRISSPAASDL